MARSDVEHWGLLNRWATVMYENQWHFNQISGTDAPLSKPGDAVYIASTRDDIANAINEACWLLIDALGFFPRPTWYTETIPLGRGEPYELAPYQTKYGYIEEFSVRTKTLVEEDVAVVYSNVYAATINDTATITVTTTIDPDEIRVYFRQADGASDDGHDNWEIEPLQITSDGTTVTIVGPRYLFVHPDNVWVYEFEDPNYTEPYRGDTQTPADFVTHVDIYRVYGATSYAVGVVSDPIWQGSTDLDSNNIGYGVARILDARLGLFEARLNCSSTVYAYPESLRVSYKSGYPLREIGDGMYNMDKRLETNIIRLANALMPWQPNTYSNHPVLSRWQSDTKPVPETQTFTGKVAPPWGGFLQGEWAAWAQLHHMRIGKGGKITARRR